MQQRGPSKKKEEGKEGGGGEKVDEYQVAVQMVGERRLADIVSYVTERGATAKPQDAINALDIVLKEVSWGGRCGCWLCVQVYAGVGVGGCGCWLCGCV